MNNLMYEIISEKDKLFHIKETATEQIISTMNSRKDAGRLMKRLKTGGGFWGFTPSFFLKKVEININ